MAGLVMAPYRADSYATVRILTLRLVTANKIARAINWL
jgi:hypothetical protein